MTVRRFYIGTPSASMGEGVVFSDGAVALRLTGHVPATIAHHSIDGMLHRHALAPHAIRWVDQEPDGVPLPEVPR